MCKPIVVLIGALLLFSSSLSQDRGDPIISQHFKAGDEIKAAVVPHIPQCVCDECFNHRDPHFINNLFASMTVMTGPSKSEGDRLICYLSDAHHQGFLQVYGRKESGWVLLTQDSTLHYGILPIIIRADVQCDGVPEILIETTSETTGEMHYDVLAVVDDKIVPMDTALFDSSLNGREIRFAIDGTGCVQKVQIIRAASGEAKDEVQYYMYDPSAGKYVRAE